MIQTLKLTAKNAVEALKNAGAEKAQSIVTYTVTHEFNVDGGEFSLFRTLFDLFFVHHSKPFVHALVHKDSGLAKAHLTVTM